MFLILTQPSLQDSAGDFFEEELKQNIAAAMATAKCLAGMASTDEYDTSMNFNTQVWRGRTFMVLGYAATMLETLDARWPNSTPFGTASIREDIGGILLNMMLDDDEQMSLPPGLAGHPVSRRCVRISSTRTQPTSSSGLSWLRSPCRFPRVQDSARMPDCIFCEASPCVCGNVTSKRRKAAPKAPKITPPPRLATGPSLAVGPATDLPVLTPPKIRMYEQPQALDTTQSDWDVEIAASLRALESILHEDEVRKYFARVRHPANPSREDRHMAATVSLEV